MIRHRHIQEIVLLIVIISVLICIGGWINGLATMQENNLRNDAKIDSAIVDSLEDNNEVSVIVILKSSESEGDIRGIQTEVLEDNPEFKIDYQYSSINGFSGTLDENALNKLRFDSNVEKIYLDKKLHITLDDSVPLINADYIADTEYKNTYLLGNHQSICIIDTGVNYNHPALAGRVINGWDYVNNDSDAMDDNSHGTHVAGIAASNDSTYIGVAPEARIIAIKACDASGNCDSSKVLAGIDWCIVNKSLYNISVISMSLGDGGEYNSGNCPSTFNSAANNATANGILIIASSGNDYHNDGISSPACVANITSVGAVTKSDVIWSQSNTGESLDLLAPGVDITSSVLGSSFASKDGTSMAAPHVAGAAALIYQHANLSGVSITPEEVKSKLKDNGINITDSDNGLNFSRVDVKEAVLIAELVASYSATPYPKTNYNITLYGNYTNKTNDGAITTGNCTLAINGSSYNMVYNATTKAYEYKKNFTTPATYSYSVKCNHSNFETLNESETIEVVQGSENCTYPGSNINWNLTGSDYSSCVGEDLIINKSNINVQDNAEFVLKDTNLTLVGASTHYVINVSSNANFTLDNVIVKGMDTSTKRLDVDLYGEGDIINSTFENSRLRILGSKTHLLDNCTLKYYSYFNENSENTIIQTTFEDYSFFNDYSINQIENCSFESRFYAYTNASNKIINSNLSGLNLIYNNAILNFTSPASNLTNEIRFYNSPKMYGSVNMPTAGMISSGNLTRYYPVYIYQNGTTTAYANKQVNITDSEGNLIWQGTTNSAGYVEPNLTLNTTNYGIGNFTISVNESEEIGLLTDTPITLEAVYNSPSINENDGGGGSTDTNCEENWSCTDWNECVNSLQTRICADINNCGTDEFKPLISQGCVGYNDVNNNDGTGNASDDEIVILNAPTTKSCCLFGICWFKYIICWYWWILLLLIMIIATISLWLINEKKKSHFRRALIKALSVD